MRFEVIHHHHHGPLPLSEVYSRFDMLQHAVAALIHHVNTLGENMSAGQDRLAKEVKETKESADAAVTAIADLRTQVGVLNGKLADVTAQLRDALAAGDDTALNAAADALDGVQAEIAGAVNPPGSTPVVTEPPAPADAPTA